ncbi:hypothetical protein TWF281_009554 [Arthrobotrys megalospora]
MAAIWRVNNHQGLPQKYSHSRSPSSPAAVDGTGTSDTSSEAHRDLIDLIPPSTPPQQSLVLLHSPSKRRIPHPHRHSPLRITTNNNNNNPSPSNINSNTTTTTAAASTSTTTNNLEESPTSQHTTTSYATLSLLSAVGPGSGRRKLKEFPGLIPLSRYFIPPSSTSTTPVAGNTPTTPTRPSSSFGGGAEVDTYKVKTIGSAFTTPNISPTNTTFKNRDEELGAPPEGIQTDDTNMEQQPPVAIVGDPEPLMTQDLLNFYKNRLHELEKSSQQELLERISVLRGFLLEHHDATNRLERQLHELQAENESLSHELQGTVKHKVEIIALQKENEVLKEKIDLLSRNQDLSPYHPAPIPSPDPSVTSSAKEEPNEIGYDKIQTHYEDLISQLLTKFTEQATARETERSLANQNIDQLNDRCRRLETAVSDSLKDTILERGKRVGLEEKLKETEEELNVSVWEMQSQIEIFERHINESRMSPEGLQTVLEEGSFGLDGADDEEFGDMIPPEMFDDLPDAGLRRASMTSGSISPRRIPGTMSPRKTPSPTKRRRTPSPTSNVKDSGVQTEDESADARDISELRQELLDMIADRRAEEEDLKTKRADLEATYERFIGIIEQAKSREEEYNHLKAETAELRHQVEDLLEQHELDQEELLTRQHDLDAMFEQLEGALKQGVSDKKEITKVTQEIDELKKQMEEVDSVSIIKDDSEIRDLKLQIEEVKKEKEALEEKLEKASVEVQGLKDLVETLNQEKHEGRPGSGSRTPTDDVDTLRKKLQITDQELANLRTQLLELESRLAAEKGKTQKEGDLKRLHEQLHGLLNGQSDKSVELTRTREELDNLRKRYDELVSDRKKDDDVRHEKYMELESTKQRLEDVMRIKEQEALLHQRDVDGWKRRDEESQEELKKVSGRLAELVVEVEGRNEVMKALNETIEKLKEADEVSGAAIEEAKKRIEELEKEASKVPDLEAKKEIAEKELEILKTTVKELEEKMKKHNMAVAGEEDGEKIQELERQLAEVNAHLEKIIEEADLEIEVLAKDLEEAKVHTVDIATEAEEKISSLEQEIEELNRIPEALKQAAESRINDLTNALDVVKTAAEEKIMHLEGMLVETKDYAEKQVNAAENELKKLDMQMKVEEARAAATITAANERIAVLEKQAKTFEVLKRHKAQDESDLQGLKSHVVKIERIALQYLPLEDSGMLNAIDELKKSHLETQQKHKKRRKKEMMMAEKSGVQL